MQHQSLIDCGLVRRASAGSTLADSDLVSSLSDDGNKGRGQSKNGCILKEVAVETASRFEVGRSKAEQLQELIRLRRARSGWLALLPTPLAKVAEYALTLRAAPRRRELVRNVLVSLFFSAISILNAQLRLAIILSSLGLLANLSILLTRNMPQKKIIPGQRSKMGAWSNESFRTALGLTGFFAVISFAVFRSALALLPPLVGYVKLRVSLAGSIVFSGIATSYFEVFEEHAQGGWRWRRAMEGYLPDRLEARLKARANGQVAGTDEVYDYRYDPMVHEFPARQRMPRLQEPGADIDDDENKLAYDDMGDLGNKSKPPNPRTFEVQQHYDNWRRERKDSRKPTLTTLRSSDRHWVGVRGGMLEASLPGWVKNADRRAMQTRQWRNLTPNSQKDTTEFKPIEGPFSFRDKTPEWILDHYL